MGGKIIIVALIASSVLAGNSDKWKKAASDARSYAGAKRSLSGMERHSNIEKKLPTLPPGVVYIEAWVPFHKKPDDDKGVERVVMPFHLDGRPYTPDGKTQVWYYTDDHYKTFHEKRSVLQ